MNAQKLLLVAAAMAFLLSALGIGTTSMIQLLPLGFLLFLLAQLAKKEGSGL